MAPAPKIVPADPQAWRQGFLNLRPSVVPCPGLTMESWAGVHEKCVDFFDRWADEATGVEITTDTGRGLAFARRSGKMQAAKLRSVARGHSGS